MNCRDFVDFLIDYLSGALPEPERQHFEEHLAECPDCVTYLATYQEAIRLGKAVYVADNDEIPSEVPDELVQAVLGARFGERG